MFTYDDNSIVRGNAEIHLENVGVLLQFSYDVTDDEKTG